MNFGINLSLLSLEFLTSGNLKHFCLLLAWQGRRGSSMLLFSQAAECMGPACLQVWGCWSLRLLTVASLVFRNCNPSVCLRLFSKWEGRRTLAKVQCVEELTGFSWEGSFQPRQGVLPLWALGGSKTMEIFPDNIPPPDL